jgi:hypothetical protein
MKRPQLTLRDLFWLTIVVALGIGWSMENRRRDDERVRHAKEFADVNRTLDFTRAKLAEAEDLLEFEGVVFGDGATIHTTPERARQLREQRRASGSP